MNDSAVTDEDLLWLAIDQGTQSSRTVVFDSSGEVVARHRVPVSLHRRDYGYIEQDAQEILDSVRLSIIEAFKQTKQIKPGRAIAAAGMATQRSSVVAWDRESGNPLSPVISWQDTRGQEFLDTISPQQRVEIQTRTGLAVSAHYGATKVAWLLNQPKLQPYLDNHTLCIGPLAAYLIYNLTENNGVCRVDHANGGRMQLMNLASRDWDQALLEFFEIQHELLPILSPTYFDYGNLRDLGVPLLVSQGDQTAAVFGYGELPPDTAHVNLGSGGFVLAAEPNHNRQSKTALLRSLARSSSESAEYFLEGTVNGAGSAVKWAAQKLGFTNPESELDHWLANINDCPLFLNCVGGIGSPVWNAAPSKTWANRWVDLAGNEVDVAPDVAMVSVLESILFLVKLNLDAMRDYGCAIGRLQVTGGLSQSNLFCQRLADLTSLTIQRPNDIESTARGVAWLMTNNPAAMTNAHSKSITFGATGDTALQTRFDAFAQLIIRDKF